MGRSSSKRSAPPEHAIDTGEDMLAGQKVFRGYGKRDDKVNIYLNLYITFDFPSPDDVYTLIHSRDNKLKKIGAEYVL